MPHDTDQNSDALAAADLAFSTPPASRPRSPSAVLADEIEHWLGVSMSIVCGETGRTLFEAPGQPWRDREARAELCRAAARLGKAEILADENDCSVLAIPCDMGEASYVAVGAFPKRPLSSLDEAASLAFVLGVSEVAARAWSRTTKSFEPDHLLSLGRLFHARHCADRKRLEMKQESDELAMQISLTYEEISMLHRLTANLSLSRNDETLARLALDGLYEVIRAEGMAVQLNPNGPAAPIDDQETLPPRYMVEGACPLSADEFQYLVDHLELEFTRQPFVANPPVTANADWPFPKVRNVVIVPLVAGDKRFGWLAAFNRPDRLEFGTSEARLMHSVATIMAIHSSNLELYRQQSDLLAGVIRALTSAIDAKDPYTCGHSDRVARIAVRLGQELNLDRATLRTIYLSGLLHDIGKIGINDAVLRKPGKLTAHEYEHIKSHVEIGYHILVDLKQLEPMLPVVRHHHEAWDGTGYPVGLKADEIPFLARIAAVADAFDAMKSDRPYRRGMDDEKINAIFKNGAGKQWDPSVVEAFFRARQDIGDVVVGAPPADDDLVDEDAWWV